ncbi:MAG: hydrogenase formation protein HypD [bacterium]
MKYIDEFRDAAAASVLCEHLAELGNRLARAGRRVAVMEVCGTHTMAVARHGIRDILPGNVELISGPGCPVCVTGPGYIDAAVELARKGCVIVTFGDMMNVPGSDTTLAAARADGAAVKVCYSPSNALETAAGTPGREVVFLGIGFEATVAAVAGLINNAVKAQPGNFSILSAFKTIPPAMSALLADPDVAIDAFLCPAHVSAIIGADAYRGIAESHGIPCVVAGFEPLDILLGLVRILEQLEQGAARVDNQYSRVVTAAGNLKAQGLMARYLQPSDAFWRGIGTIPGSGLTIRPEYADMDAAVRLGIEVLAGRTPAGCRCGDVISGKLRPQECRMFGSACTPENPVGSCMVSSEGTCASFFRYAAGKGAQVPG